MTSDLIRQSVVECYSGDTIPENKLNLWNLVLNLPQQQELFLEEDL